MIGAYRVGLGTSLSVVHSALGVPDGGSGMLGTQRPAEPPFVSINELTSGARSLGGYA